MSYLQDKKAKSKKITSLLLAFLVFICLIYFRVGIFNGLSSATHFIFKPVLVLGNGIEKKVKNIGAFFYSKKVLLADNNYLKSQLSENENKMANYSSLLAENENLKEMMNRKTNRSVILAGILSKPSKSIYDTLLVDAGKNEGVIVGQRVFALGDVPIGRVVEVYLNSSNVILFSNPGEKTEGVIGGKNVFMELVGRGGGNFEMILPRDFIIEIGTEVSLPGINSFVIARVVTILSDPRDSFTKALLVSPVNIQGQKFVEIEK